MRTDQRVVVISGASSGIGFSAAECLGELGNLVLAGARQADDIVRLSSMTNVRGVKLDITRKDDINTLAKQVTAATGHIDVLINNAGIPGWGAVMDREIEYYRKVMEVNLFGHVQMVQAFYPLLRQSRSLPIIINISSQAGNYAFPFWSAYHMSKWALEAFSDCLRRELLPYGIRVAVVQPGAIKSEAFNSQMDDFVAYQDAPASEFRARATTLLQAAFHRPPDKEKDPEVVIRDILHAIYNKRNKLYYQPGRRFVPDIVMSTLPRAWLDKLFARLFPVR